MVQENATAEVEISGTITGNPQMAKFARYLANRAELDRDEINGQEIAANIASRILEAESIDDVWGADEGDSMPNATDLVGVEQQIQSYEIRKSGDPGKSNALTGNTFLIVHSLRLSDGSPIDWNTSATGIVTKIVKLDQLDALPVNCVIVEKGASKALTLRRVSDRVI